MRNVVTAILLVVWCGVVVLAQPDPRIKIDPKTGRAVGAKESSPEDLKAKLDSHAKVVIVDVRDPGEFAKGTLPGAINIPLPQLKARLNEFPKDTTFVFT